VIPREHNRRARLHVVDSRGTATNRSASQSPARVPESQPGQSERFQVVPGPAVLAPWPDVAAAGADRIAGEGANRARKIAGSVEIRTATRTARPAPTLIEMSRRADEIVVAAPAVAVSWPEGPRIGRIRGQRARALRGGGGSGRLQPATRPAVPGRGRVDGSTGAEARCAMPRTPPRPVPWTRWRHPPSRSA